MRSNADFALPVSWSLARLLCEKIPMRPSRMSGEASVAIFVDAAPTLACCWQWLTPQKQTKEVPNGKTTMACCREARADRAAYQSGGRSAQNDRHRQIFFRHQSPRNAVGEGDYFSACSRRVGQR